MPKLTKRLLDALAPETEETFVWDSDVKGFGLRIKPTGATAFVLKYRIGTRTKRFTIGKVGSPHTVETARAEAKKLLGEIARGHDPMEERVAARAEITVGELAQAYLDEGAQLKPNKKASSWATDKIVLTRHVSVLLGAKLASKVTPSDIGRMQADIAAGKTAVIQKTKSRGLARVSGGRRVAAMSLAVLSGAFSFGIATQRVKVNPCLGVPRLKNPPRERFLSNVEVGLIGDALAELEAGSEINSDMAAAIRMLMVTGARKSEITDLRWTWVDFERRVLRLPDSKTGPKTIPLAAPALAILAERPRPAGAVFVFPAARGDGPTVGVPRAWKAVKTRAADIILKRAAETGDGAFLDLDVASVRLHDLRHTFASFAVADGASLYVIGKVLGHKNARTTEVYAHLRDDPLQAVAESAAAQIAAAMAPRNVAGFDNVHRLKTA